MNKGILWSFVDFFSCMFAFFVLAFLINMDAKKEDTQGNLVSKAEFAVILEWDEGSDSDVDLWIRNPYKNVMNFQSPDTGMMTLDRDDMGNRNNTIRSENGQIVNNLRREMGMIRKIMPGEHVVNVMAFNLKGQKPKVRVSIIKLNPYLLVAEKEVVLTTDGEENTIATFNVSENGTVSNVNTENKISLIKGVK